MTLYWYYDILLNIRERSQISSIYNSINLCIFNCKLVEFFLFSRFSLSVTQLIVHLISNMKLYSFVLLIYVFDV